MYKNLKLLLLFTLNSISMMLDPSLLNPNRDLTNNKELSNKNICEVRFNDKENTLMIHKFPFYVVDIKTNKNIPYPLDFGFEIRGTEISKEILKTFEKTFNTMNINIDTVNHHEMSYQLYQLFNDILQNEFPTSKIFTGQDVTKYILEHFFIINGINSKSLNMLQKYIETLSMNNNNMINLIENKNIINLVQHISAISKVIFHLEKFIVQILLQVKSENPRFNLDKDLEKNLIFNMKKVIYINTDGLFSYFFNNKNKHVLSGIMAYLNLSHNIELYFYNDDKTLKTSTTLSLEKYEELYKIYILKSEILKNPVIYKMIYGEIYPQYQSYFTNKDWKTYFKFNNLYITCNEINEPLFALLAILTNVLEKTNNKENINVPVYNHVIFNPKVVKEGFLNNIMYNGTTYGVWLKVLYPDSKFIDVNKTKVKNNTIKTDPNKWFFKTTTMTNTYEGFNSNPYANCIGSLIIDPYFSKISINMNGIEVYKMIEEYKYKLLYLKIIELNFYEKNNIDVKTLDENIENNIKGFLDLIKYGNIEHIKTIFHGLPHLENINKELSKTGILSSQSKFAKEILKIKKNKEIWSLKIIEIILPEIKDILPKTLLEIEKLNNNFLSPITSGVGTHNMKHQIDPTKVIIRIPEKNMNIDFKTKMLEILQKNNKDQNNYPLYTLQVETY